MGEQGLRNFVEFPNHVHVFAKDSLQPALSCIIFFSLYIVSVF